MPTPADDIETLRREAREARLDAIRQAKELIDRAQAEADQQRQSMLREQQAIADRLRSLRRTLQDAEAALERAQRLLRD